MTLSVSRWKALLLIAATLAAGAVGAAPAAAATAAPPAPRFVVFGDSLSDPGNFYAAFGLSSTAPYSLIPSAPYTIGGHHFTNGKTWIEQLSTWLGTPDGGRPALVAPGVYGNYAVGGARARPNAPDFPYYDLSTQVGIYLGTRGGHAAATTVHVIWFGGNDVRDALEAAATDPSLATSTAIVAEAVQTTASNIVTLWSAGARTFLVPDVPDLSKAPAVVASGPAAVGGALELTTAYNAALGQALAELGALPGIRLIRVGDFGLVDAIVTAPERFGIEDAATPCVHVAVVVDALCSDPEEHLFWDGIHPTVAGHRIVAIAALKALVKAEVAAR